MINSDITKQLLEFKGLEIEIKLTEKWDKEMKTYTYFDRILTAGVISFFILLLPVKAQSQNALDVFPKDALPVVHELIAFYDSIVQTAHPEIKDIGKAYDVYLDTVCPKILHDGNFAHSGIDHETRRKLLDRLDKKGPVAKG